MSTALPPLLTTIDVALWLSVPPSRTRLVRSGAIPHVVLPNGEILFEPSALASWAEGLCRDARNEVRHGD